MPLRIVVDARHVRDFGIGSYIRNLIRALAEMPGDEQYTLITNPADRQELAGLPERFSTAVYERRDQNRLDHFAFPLFLRQFQADVCHLPVNLVPLAMPRPYVVTVHDLSGLLFETPPGWHHQLRLFRTRRGLMRAERVIAVSDATRQDVEQLLGIPAGRIERIYGGPDPAYLEPPPSESESRRTLDRYQINYPFLLYSGKIKAQKNIPRLIEAFALLRGELDQHPRFHDLRLIIIGDEISHHPEVRQAVIHSRVQPQVRFLGFVPQETQRIFYAAAEAFVFPSLYEGFGLPPLEAMAAGTPVVASNASSLPEAVGDAALQVNPDIVFDIARGLKEALLDEGVRAVLRVRGRERVRKFQWRETARQTLEIYRAAAQRNRPS
jgi:glycosyltransferase involved in cell wall biosynthesis